MGVFKNMTSFPFTVWQAVGDRQRPGAHDCTQSAFQTQAEPIVQEVEGQDDPSTQ